MDYGGINCSIIGLVGCLFQLEIKQLDCALMLACRMMYHYELQEEFSVKYVHKKYALKAVSKQSLSRGTKTLGR